MESATPWTRANHLVTADIVFGHSPDGETPLEFRADPVAVEFADALYCFNRLRLIVHNETGDPVLDYLGNGTAPERYHRRPARHCLDHDQAKWLRPINRKQQRCRISQKAGFLFLAHFANELRVVLREIRLNLLLKVGAVATGYLCTYPKRQTYPPRQTNCDMGSLFGRNAAQERQIPIRFVTGPEQIRGHSVIDR